MPDVRIDTPLPTNVEVQDLYGVGANDVTYSMSVSRVAAAVSETINVTHEGILATNADNGPALIALRDRLITEDPKKHWELYFPSANATYKYSNSRWPRGLERLTLRGYGAALQPTFASQWNQWDPMVFSAMTSMMVHKGDRDGYGGMAWEMGDLIDSTVIGSQTITLKTVGDATKYAVGDNVFVYSHVQQGSGWPINARKFQWMDITAIDTGNGTITFEQRHRHAHQDDIYDVIYDLASSFGQDGQQNIGKARILKLSGRAVDTGLPAARPKYLSVNGFKLHSNPNFPTNWCDVSPYANEVRFTDVQAADPFIRYTPREFEFFIMDNVSMTYMEADKLGGVMTIKNSHIGKLDDASQYSMFAATSIEHVYMENVDCDGVISLAPLKSLHIQGGRACSLGLTNADTAAPIEMYGGSFGCEFVNIQGVDLQRLPNQSKVLMGYSNLSFKDYIVAGVNGNAISVPRVGSATELETLDHFVRSSRAGMQILESDETTVIGRVSHIIEGAGDTIEIHLTVTGTMPSVTDTIKYRPTWKVVHDGEVLWKDV